MNRPFAALLGPAAAILVLIVTPVALAGEAPGGTGGGNADLSSGNASRDSGSIIRSAENPGVDLRGKVVDVAGAPIGGVRVKLFNAGILAGHARTASDGTFNLQANPHREDRTTLDIWFESPDPDKYIDVNVVLATERAGLFPGCTPRITLRSDAAVVEVTLRSAEQTQEQLKTSDCLQGGAVQGPAAR